MQPETEIKKAVNFLKKQTEKQPDIIALLIKTWLEEDKVFIEKKHRQ